MSEVTVWHNPRCSKCRTAIGILSDEGVSPTEYRYLDERPARAEIERVLGLLGTDDPMAIVRTGEDIWRQLDVDPTDRDAVLDALAEHPVLIERPIVIRGDQAVIGRPPENVLGLLRD